MIITSITIFIAWSFTPLKSFLLVLLFTIFLIVITLDSMYLGLYSTSLLDGYWTVCDEYSTRLLYIIAVVLFFRLLVYYQSFKSDSHTRFKQLWVLIVVISAGSAAVFCNSSLLVVYIGYEASLIPIILIIYGWGVYPERVYSSIAMLIYTLLFRLPLLGVLGFMWYKEPFSLSLRVSQGVPLLDSLVRVVFTFLLLIAFAVKLPVYGIHNWLPLAHVEAPTFGSMILAGLLLKLGGAGLNRFSSVIPSLSADASSSCLSYLLVSIVVVSVITCTQNDLKRLIAYSSVVHMTRVGLLFVLRDKVGLTSALILIVMHGISSPLIFFMVGELYRRSQTRSLLLIRSMKLFFPVLYFTIIVVFFLTVPVPPALTFLAEVVLFVSILKYGSFTFILSGLYLFLAIIFNLIWLSCFFGRHWPYITAAPGVVSLYTPVAIVLLGGLGGLLCNSLFI